MITENGEVAKLKKKKHLKYETIHRNVFTLDVML